MNRRLFFSFMHRWKHRLNEAKSSTKEQPKEILSELVSFVVQTATIISGFHFVGTYVFHLSSCIGPSMLPTVRESGDIVLVDRFLRHVIDRKYKKGDIVIAWAPYDPDKLICKRISGCAGDTVQREYKIGSRTIRSDITIPPGHVWLLGDNPNDSKDSRHYGSVPEQLISGRVLFKVWWPPQKFF